MKWFQNFMRGRYGVDQLSFALLILYFVITILGTAFRIPYIGYVALLLIVWCWFRILSRNTYKRSQENAKFMGWIYPIQNKWRTKKREFQDRKTHKYYNCPNCKQRLRVPKGRGVLLRLPARNVKQSLTSVRNSYCRRNILTAVFFHTGRFPREASCSWEKQPFLCLFTPA
ncbi:MAG: hypothetical protein ACLTDX_17775 [[Clostridium] innocuum]